jgi:hypothetical protein
MGSEKSSEKNTEPMRVEANNPLLKREKRAWHNSSNAMTTKDMHFLLTLCAHALSLGPFSDSMRDGTTQLLPVCTICPLPLLLIGRNVNTLYVNTLSGLILQQMGWGGFEGLWSLIQKPFCVIRGTFLPKIQFLVMRENPRI